jgi:superfamily II DNA or RNA helicase
MSRSGVKNLKTREQSFDDASSFFFIHHKVILEYCTGFGKTYQALRLISKSITDDGKSWAIIVPTQNLIKGWTDEIEKWKLAGLKGKIEIICYNSIHKLEGIDHFCFDEGHNITELRVEKLLDKIDKKRSKLICLSATIDAKKFALLKILGFMKHHRHIITLDEGVEAGVVTEYNIIGLPMTPNQAWLTTNKGIEYWLNSEKRKGNSRGIESAIFKRMRHVYNSSQKLELAKYVCDNLTPGDKILIYVANIEQAMALSEHTGFPAYHSKISKKKRAQMLEDFNSQKEGGLISCYTLNEGANIVGVNKALIVQTRSNEREAIQRLGRILRFLGKLIGQPGVCYIAYLKGTQDEKWARSSIRSFDKAKVWGRLVEEKHYYSPYGTIPKKEEQ